MKTGNKHKQNDDDDGDGEKINSSPIGPVKRAMSASRVASVVFIYISFSSPRWKKKKRHLSIDSFSRRPLTNQSLLVRYLFFLSPFLGDLAGVVVS